MNPKQHKFSFIAPLIVMVMYLLMFFINYVYNGKKVMSKISDTGLIKAGAMNGDSPFYRVFTGAFLQSSIWSLVIAIILLILTFVYIEKTYGFGVYLTVFLLTIILSGFLSIHLTPNHVTASSIAVMCIFIGMLVAHYIKYKKQDVLVISIISGIFVLAAFFIPGGYSINIIISLLMLLIGVGVGFLIILLYGKAIETGQNMEYKRRMKEQAKEEKEQERIQKQKEKIQKKHQG